PLVQFLMTLRQDFEGLRGLILHREPLLSIDSVVSELLAEEFRLKSLDVLGLSPCDYSSIDASYSMEVNNATNENQINASKIREKTAGNLGAGASGVSCDGSLKVSNSSPWISRNATINMPRGLYNVDVAATFGVPLTTAGMTNDKRMAVMDALGAICDSIQAENSIPSNSTPSDPIMQSVDINTKATSYARVAGASAKDQPKVNSNFRPLVTDPVFDDVNISIPRKVVEKVSTRFEHTLYGYFIGKRMSFLVVEYYARNNWVKHGLKRIMMNTKCFFFFKFDTRVGLETVLEGGPWMILKLHDVPIQVFEEDGISLIVMFIGKHVIVDSYTSYMCNDSWGRSSFARCLIEVNSEVDLVDTVTIGIPSLTEDDFTKETIRVEYEWRSPMCDLCKIFGHVHDHCPKKVASPPIVTTSNAVTPIVEKTNDGFQMMGKKKKRKGTLVL
ncbi:zinc knuckle CX2CX4HX4C containing protein, partial [Tanacetum coccineum]